jgi:hypothetical protein
MGQAYPDFSSENRQALPDILPKQSCPGKKNPAT